MSWLDGEFQIPDQQVLSTPDNVWNWDSPQAEFGPVFEWGNQGQLGGMPIGGLPPSFQQFGGGMNVQGSSSMASPTGTPPGMPSGLPPSPTATTQAQAQLPIGGGGMPDEGRSGGAPRTGGAGGGVPAPAAYRPPTAPNEQGGFDWKKMLGGIGGQVAASGTQALIGGGLGLLGKALGPSAPKQQGSAPAPGPTPPPQTPTGTPNMGPPAPPAPGAQWSPLLMQQPGGSAAGSAAGLEAQKRMRRGGQTGGMSLY